MMEERLDRIEQLMVQLIQMVAENNAIVKGTAERVDGMEQRFDGLEQRFDGLEQRFDGLEQRCDGLEQRFDGLEQRFDNESKLNQQRHHEIMKEIRNTNFEVDYLRNQASKHDMAIHKLEQLQTAST